MLAPVLKSVSLAPSSVTGGSNTAGTLTLNGPAPIGGIKVALQSSDPSVTVPLSVTINGNTKSATFKVTTTKGSPKKTVTITATLNGVPRSALLTIK